ncbi:helix-turn-helix domain-containing protein [Pseudonocardia eucalypti]|uniref:Helix-turn-helix domain-containing protein n=1 Tax=Pseudonocardia eucalypti TaxID=648755 RepID=A0ABP9PQK1_9PSEU|nr:hypothetical protein [Pseudonocardia eucalypti]
MTLLDERPAAPERGEPAVVTLLGLLAGAHRFDVLAAPRGLDVPVTGVTIWDAHAPDRLCRGDLVLAPDAARPDLLLPEAGRAGVSAVLVKGVDDLPAWRELAEHARVALLLAAGELCWDDICLTARALLPAARLTAPAERPHEPGRLFELAEAAAVALRAPVLITDAELRVLAFAHRDQPLDPLRVKTILARRVPESGRDWLTRTGELARLRHTREPVRLTPPGGSPRLVAPVLARDSVVGYVSVAEADRLLSAEELAVAADVAASAAPAFLPDPPAAAPDEDLLVSRLLRGVLAGRGALRPLTERLRPARSGRRVTAAGRTGCDGTAAGRTEGPATAEAAGEWFLIGFGGSSDLPDHGLLARCARLTCPGATAVGLDGRVFVLAGYPGPAGAVRLAERLRSRYAEFGGPGLATCLSEPFGPDGDPASLSRDLARALDLPPDGIGRLEELRPRLVLAELAELTADHPNLLASGPLASLRRADAARYTDHLDTLLAFFDAGADLGAAAKRLCIHRNTLRYRMRRIETLGGFDLADPVARFTTELQVRLARATAR